jgi:hypothetical protein
MSTNPRHHCRLRLPQRDSDPPHDPPAAHFDRVREIFDGEEQLGRGVGDGARESPLLAQPRPVPPGGARQHDEEREHADDRQVDLRPQPSHHSSSCLRAKT